MSKKETEKRYVLFVISLFISALGVAFTKHGGYYYFGTVHRACCKAVPEAD